MAKDIDRVRKFFEALENAPLQKFPAAGERLSVPEVQGVYAIYPRRGANALHVGRTVKGRKGLRQRLTNHLHGQSSFVNGYLGGDASQVRTMQFKYVEVEDARLRALLEAYAIGQYCPRHIGTAHSPLETELLDK